MEPSIKHFVLKESSLHYVKDMPEHPKNLFEEFEFRNGYNSPLFHDELKKFEVKKEKAISSSIPVANQEEVIQSLSDPTLTNMYPGEGLLRIGEIYPLECEVEIKDQYLSCNCNANGSIFEQDHLQYCDSNIKTKVAFVKLKGETKEEAKHEIFEGCPCVVLDKPCKDNCSCVNIYSSAGCSYCAKYGSIEQRKFAAERISSALQDAVTKEEEQYEMINDFIETYFENDDKSTSHQEMIEILKSKYIITKR